jgi:hypothetical protein
VGGANAGDQVFVPDDKHPHYLAEIAHFITFVCNVRDVKKQERHIIASSEKVKRLEPLDDKDGLTEFIALDCEMVGVGAGGWTSALARVCDTKHNFFNDLS